MEITVMNDTLRSAQDTVAGVTALHKRIQNLESRLKTMQTRAEHYRALTLAQSRDIKRLKKGLKV